jgi:methyl-accepting chemotaxis protein
VRLPHLSIATKLYAIFVLLATVTVALAMVAVLNARRHAALTGDFEAAFAGALNVERMNALIYATEMEARGILMAPDAAAAKGYTASLRRLNDRIGDVLTEWQWVVRPEDDAPFQGFADRIKPFQELRRVLMHGTELGSGTPHAWRDNEKQREVRAALNKDLEAFGRLSIPSAPSTSTPA